MLLSTLSPGAIYEQAFAATERLAPPGAFSPDAAQPPVAQLRGGLMAPLDDKPPAQVFALLCRAGWASAYASRSFWWTAGGDGFRPLALAVRLLPDPVLFAAMLTGHFSDDARG